MQHKSSPYPLIHPIRISTPFAVGDVFSYLITDEKNILVDTGHFAENAFEAVAKKVQKIGLELKEIDEIWLTHGHPDHFGLAKFLADHSGAKVYGHPKGFANFTCNTEHELFLDFFTYHHIPEQLIGQMIEQIDWLQQYQQPIEPEWIKQGDHLSSGQLSFNVEATPGHSSGHVAFCSNEGYIFGGDLLLDHVSTNALINFDPDTARRNKSLLQYRESLKWIREQEGAVFPGHGQIIENIADVANHHLQEQEQRYGQIKQLLHKKSMSLLDLCYEIFPDAIDEGAIFLVLSEVIGYLDWGVEERLIILDESRKPTYHIAQN